MKLPPLRDGLAGLVFMAALTVAVVLVESSHPFHEPQPMNEKLARRAFWEIASKEAQQRSEAASRFPGDLWSQDDDFHGQEQEAVHNFASAHDVRVTDVLDALDQGMREQWPVGSKLNPRVPPCRPRLDY